MAFNRFTKNVLNVSALPDRVQNQASTLKATFDQAGVDIKEALNSLITELEASTSASNIGANIGSVTTKTVQAILTNFEDAIANRYTKLEADTLLSEGTNELVSNFDIDLNTGIITITRKDGTVETFDTALEKVPAKFELVEENGKYALKITNVDGTTTQTDVTELIDVYTFNNSDYITFDVTGEGKDKTVTARIKANSIGLSELELNVVSTLEGYMASARDSASAAKTSETNARASELNALEAKASATNSASSATTSAQTASNASKTAQEMAQTVTTTSQQAVQTITSVANNAKTEVTTTANNAKTELTATSTQAKAETNSNAILARSYAVGGTGSRAGEDTDNAKYYSEQAKATVSGDFVTRPEFQEGIKDFATEEYVDNALAAYEPGGGLTEIPIATADTLGGIKIGEGFEMTSDGVLSVLGASGEAVNQTVLWEGTLQNDDETVALSDSLENYNFILVESCITDKNGATGAYMTNLLDVNTIKTYNSAGFNMFTSADPTKHWYRVSFNFTNATTLQMMKANVSSNSWINPQISKAIGIKLGGNYIINGKEFLLDSTPTAGSQNLVSSGGVKTYVDNQVATKVDSAYVNTAISGKADTTYVNTQIASVNSTLTNKADTTYVNNQVSTLNTAISGKANSTHTHAISDVTNLQSTLDGKAPVSHTQAASTITAGTFAGQVNANATAVASVGTAQIRNITASTTDLTAGTSALTTGEIYFVYE